MCSENLCLSSEILCLLTEILCILAGPLEDRDRAAGIKKSILGRGRGYRNIGSRNVPRIGSRVDCSRAIHDQVLKKVDIPLKIVAVFEHSENSCRSSEKSGHFSEKRNSL